MLDFRKFNQADEELLVAYLNEDDFTKFMTDRIPTPYTNESAAWWVNVGSKEGIVYAIIENGILVGSIGAIPGIFEKRKSAEIGYWVAKPHWAKGIASESVRKFVSLLYEQTDLVRLHASVFEGNQASAKVLEKNGFKLDAVFEKSIYKNDKFFNELYYSKILS